MQLSNRVTVAYIQFQGETHSNMLLKEVKPITPGTEDHQQNSGSSLPPSRFFEQVQASQSTMSGSMSQVSSELVHMWGLPQTDLLVSHSNHKLWVCLTLFPYPKAQGADALVSPGTAI